MGLQCSEEKHREFVSGTIEILEQTESKNEHEELVEDILTIIVSFSGRIYGARGGRKRHEESKNDYTC